MKYIPCLLALLVSGCATTSQGSVIVAVAPTEDGGLLVRRCKIVLGSNLAVGGLINFGVDQPIEFDECETITVEAWQPDEEGEI